MIRHETGPSAVALGLALGLTCSVLDSLLSPRLGAILGSGFVLTCLWLALSIQHRHFFPVGVLPPLLLTGVLLLTALLRPAALEGATALDRTVGGLVDQRLALVLAWAGTLLVLLIRSARSRPPRAAAPRERPRTSPPPSSAPPGSPLLR